MPYEIYTISSNKDLSNPLLWQPSQCVIKKDLFIRSFFTLQETTRSHKVKKFDMLAQFAAVRQRVYSCNCRRWRIQEAKVLCNHKENCEVATRAKQDDYMIVLKAMRNARKARFLTLLSVEFT